MLSYYVPFIIFIVSQTFLIDVIEHLAGIFCGMLAALMGQSLPLSGTQGKRQYLAEGRAGIKK